METPGQCHHDFIADFEHIHGNIQSSVLFFTLGNSVFHILKGCLCYTHLNIAKIWWSLFNSCYLIIGVAFVKTFWKILSNVSCKI